MVVKLLAVGALQSMLETTASHWSMLVDIRFMLGLGLSLVVPGCVEKLWLLLGPSLALLQMALLASTPWWFSMS